MADIDLTSLPATFYRVSLKALIFDDQQRLLVFQQKSGVWEIPGGGWEFGESLEECVRRELAEEVHARVAAVGDIAFVYAGRHEQGYHKLCVAVKVTLAPAQLTPEGDDLVAYRYVTPEEFVTLPFDYNEKTVVQYKDKIWSEV